MVRVGHAEALLGPIANVQKCRPGSRFPAARHLKSAPARRRVLVRRITLLLAGSPPGQVLVLSVQHRRARASRLIGV